GGAQIGHGAKQDQRKLVAQGDEIESRQGLLTEVYIVQPDHTGGTALHLDRAMGQGDGLRAAGLAAAQALEYLGKRTDLASGAYPVALQALARMQAMVLATV